MNLHRHRVFSLAILLLLACFGSYATARDEIHTLRHDGLTRRFLVHLPPQYTKGKDLPMVMVFHGGGGNIENIMRETRMNVAADRHGFIAVYPAGTGGKRRRMLTWNAGYCCGEAKENNVDDVGFVSKLIDFMVSKYQVDSHRVYATGHSNGAMLSFRLACELPERITAVAPNSGHGRVLTCRRGTRPVPIMYLHGTEDKGLPIEGGECGGMFQDFLNSVGIPADRKSALWKCDSVQAVLKKFAARNGCSTKTRRTPMSGATLEGYLDCPKGGEVEFYLLDGAGHTWPGGEYGTDACERKPDGRLCQQWKDHAGAISRFNANEKMWEFFSKYKIDQQVSLPQ